MQTTANGTVAEQIAQDTWVRLKLAQRFDTRLGEETLTDLLVLDIVSQMPSRSLMVFPTSKIKEATQGTDLVVCVHRGGAKADVYAIQAKKLYPSGRYGALKARSGKSPRLQIDTLEGYAMAINAIPLYLLYNYVDSVATCKKCWHCCQTVDQEQLGCTLAPSWRIRRAILLRCRTFDNIHSGRDDWTERIDQSALPWRCAFDCPNGQPWEQVRARAKESHDIFLNRGFFSDGTRSEILRDLNFESKQGVWPGNLWEQGASYPTVRDMESRRKEEILRLFGSHIEVANETGGISPPDKPLLPRWLLLVGETACDRQESG